MKISIFKKAGLIVFGWLLLLVMTSPSFALEILTRTFYTTNNYGAQLQLRYTYYLNAAGEEVLHGTRTQYYIQTSIYTMNQVSLIERYSHGKKHGLEEAWYQGTFQYTYQKHWEKEYQDGQLHGVSRQWGQQYGYLESYATYRYGKLHGPYRTYDYEWGHQTLEANYDNGMLHGYYKKWVMKTADGYRSQYQQEEGYYAYGKKQDLWKTWCTDNANSYYWYNPKNEGKYGNNLQCGSWKNFNCNNWLTPPTYTTYPVCQGVLPPGVGDPLPPGNKYEIRGHVTDWQTNQPLADVTVQAGAAGDTSSADGFYSLVLDNSGTYSLNAVKTGYFDYTRTVNLTDAQYVDVNIIMKPVEAGGKPVITSVETKGGTFFIEGFNVDNEYVVNVNWNDGTPGIVIFEVNGTPYEETATDSGASHTFDMGADFTGSLSPTGNTLKITAVNAAGIESRQETLNPIVIPLPSWSVAMGDDFEIKQDGSHLNYKLNTSWPEEPIEILVDEKYLGSVLWTAWGFVPYIGGRVFGIPGTQSFLTVEAKTDGTGSIAAGGLSGFEAAGGKIEIKLGGKGNLKYEPNLGLEWKETSLILGLSGTIERTVGPVTLIPALEGAVNLPVIGGAVSWFNERAKIKGTIKAGAETALEIMSATGEIGFNRADVETGVGLELGMGVDVIEGLEAGIKGGGTGKVFWQVPAAPDYFKKLETELSGSISLTFLGFEWSTGYTHPYTYPESVPQSLPVLGPVSRDFITRKPYNVLAVEPSRLPLDLGGTGPLSEHKVIENVFPYSEPAIAESGGKAAIAYVYLDPGKPVHQETDIYFSLFDGANYTAPAAILSDTRAEFAPSIAYDNNGKIVCVWQRVKNENFTSGQIEDLAAELEIVYAIYDPSAPSPAWTEPAVIPDTDNGFMDYSPFLKTGADGSLLLMWFSNQGNRLVGNNDYPTSVHYAFWDAAAGNFGSPADLPMAFENSFKFSLAYNGTEAVLAYMKDMDGVFITPAGAVESAAGDQEIFYVTWDGENWNGPVRVTDDQTPDASPRVAYRGSTHELVWLRGDALVRLVGSDPLNVESILENVTASGSIDFRLFSDPEDRLVLLWQDSDEKGIDLFYLVQDPINGVWSSPLRLTQNAGLEKDARGVFGANSLFHLIFNRRDLVGDTVDLYHLTYKLAADLAVGPGDLTVAPAEAAPEVDPVSPAPGDAVILQCRIANAGDLTILNPSVSFYLGNPAAGGELLGTATISPEQMKAGDTGLALLHWTIPANITQYTVYAVADAGAGVVENTTNNTTSLDVVKPDLKAVRCNLERRPDGSLAVRAEIRNDGARPAENVEVLFKAEATIIGSMTIPGILPGKSADLVYPAALEIFSYTTPEPLISVTADPENRIDEFREDNNTAAFVYSLEMLSSSIVDFGEVHYAGGMGTVTVFNKTTTALVIGEIIIAGSDAGQFRIFDNSLSGSIIQPQKSALVGISFYPTSLGDKNAILIIKDAGGKVLWQASLTGRLDYLIRGDVNDDSQVDLADAILALQVAAGQRPAGLNAVVDVDGNGRIGMAEAVYVLQTAAELR